jgi:hypothetical protein
VSPGSSKLASQESIWCCLPTAFPGLSFFSLFALLESLSPVIMSPTTPRAVLQPSHTHGTAFIPLLSWACPSQRLRDFTLNSVQFVPITPMLTFSCAVASEDRQEALGQQQIGPLPMSDAHQGEDIAPSVSRPPPSSEALQRSQRWVVLT